jgi:hypothetical protein
MTVRTIFALALAFGVSVAAGCGSKTDQPQPKADLKPEPNPEPNPGPNPDPNAKPKDEPKAAWEMDPAKHTIPAGGVKGRVGGAEVSLEAAVEGNDLVFRTGKDVTPERRMLLKLRKSADESLENRKWAVRQDTPAGAAVPEVWLELPPQPIHAFSSGYALTLELGQRKDGKVPGKVYLSLPDDEKSFLAGTFTADYARAPGEPPGADDAPFAAGEVTVTGAKPDTTLRVTYAGLTPSRADGAKTDLLIKELQAALTQTPDAAGWSLDDSDKPRVSTLFPGDGKMRPSRYEHVKLVPGRYLLTATVTGGGPITWKWVDVPADGKVKENLTLDLTKTGGLEVNAPPGSTGQVQIVPADDPGRPPIDASHFFAIAVQMRLTGAVVGGKATFKDLAPGKYEVRIDGERKTVDIVAGKTAELDFTPPKK